MNVTQVKLTFDGSRVDRLVRDGTGAKSHTVMPPGCDQSDIGIYDEGEFYTVTIRRHRANDFEWKDRT